MREKELRLALVCYGGVSLAIYMHGIVKEVWKLLRASRAAQDRRCAGAPAALEDSEAAYAALLDHLAPQVDIRVLVDIIAGASAGGINGVFLAHAIAGGHDMEPLRDLWLDDADIERLLDPDAAPSSRFSKFYAAPLVWLAGGKALDVDSIPERETRDEVTVKLSRFIRSRWFEPPFSGPGFTKVLYKALGAMEAGQRGKPLLPPGQPLDLKVTVTDFRGYPERLVIHSPPEIVETEHRLVVAFRDDGRPAEGGERAIGSRASLAFAARATASFPGAFPPFGVRELDGVLLELGHGWADRDAFLATTFPRRASNPEGAILIDGSVLNNAPFRPAIEALGNRPAHREVDRRFVYIDPKPGGRLIGAGKASAGEPPGFLTTILRALSDIPREQPIRDAVESLNNLSERVRRLRRIVASMRDEVDAAIERALGMTVRSATPERLAIWRDKLQTAAAHDAGYAFAAYGHLKIGQVVDWVSCTLTLAGGPAAVERAGAVNAKVWDHARSIGVDRVAASGRESLPPETIAFLRGFDLPFRVRRLRFVIRRLNEIVAELPANAARGALDRFKTALYAQLAPFLDRRTPAFLGAQALPDVLANPAAALAALGAALKLAALDAQAEAAFAGALADKDLDPAHRRALLLAWLGFPFYDIVTLPLLQGEGFDEFDAVKVDRISPDDAKALHVDGKPTALKGAQFNGFGAFFSRAWREHDYLWGRLHAADRLIDIVASTAPEPPEPWVLAALKTKAFTAILDAEREHLPHVGDLIGALRATCGVP